jgi:hypothetical protein
MEMVQTDDFFDADETCHQPISPRALSSATERESSECILKFMADFYFSALERHYFFRRICLKLVHRTVSSIPHMEYRSLGKIEIARLGRRCILRALIAAGRRASYIRVRRLYWSPDTRLAPTAIREQ